MPLATRDGDREHDEIAAGRLVIFHAECSFGEGAEPPARSGRRQRRGWRRRRRDCRAVSVTLVPTRSAIVRCDGGGIMWSSVATRYQLGLLRHAGSVIVPPRASRPQGTCESAMNTA